MIDIIVQSIVMYLRLVEKLLKVVHIRFRGVQIGPIEFELKQRTDSSYQETIEKIDATRQHLRDAIAAVDTLQTEIETRKGELDKLLASVRSTEEQKQLIDQEYEFSHKLLAEDKERLKEVLGFYQVPVSGKDKVLGFVGGVLASLVAAGVWALATYFIKK